MKNYCYPTEFKLTLKMWFQTYPAFRLYYSERAEALKTSESFRAWRGDNINLNNNERAFVRICQMVVELGTP